MIRGIGSDDDTPITTLEIAGRTVPFDGELVLAEITYVPGEQVLIGTRVMREHRLEIDFPGQTLRLERVGEKP